MEAVFQFKSCSRLVRLDMGTENVDIARMQALMSGDSSFLVGRVPITSAFKSFGAYQEKKLGPVLDQYTRIS